MITRRDFLDTLATSAASLALSSTAKSYAQILGSNDRLTFAIIGLNGRAYAHLSSLRANRANARVAAVCDVESNILAKFAGAAKQSLGYQPDSARDFRRVLERKDIDAVTIATPDHWHTPMAIDALQAGKHVYVEKPCSHNPAEGALLVAAQKKYGKLVQMGTQQRSSPHTIEIVRQDSRRPHRPRLLRPRLVRQHPQVHRHRERSPRPRHTRLGSLARSRAAPDISQTTSSPTTGTGSASGAPAKPSTTARTKSTSAAGPSASTTPTALPLLVDATSSKTTGSSTTPSSPATNTKTSSSRWEGRSCSGMKMYNRDRGSTILGTTGSVLVDRDGYEVYDLGGHKTSEYRVPEENANSSADPIGADSMTDAHFANFIAGVTHGEKLNAPVEVGNVAVTMLQLSNIAWEVQRFLNLDPADGKIQHDPEAMKGWSREYQPGWEPKL